MAEVKLCVGVYGEGTIFSVCIRSNASVGELQKVIAKEYNTQINHVHVYPATLTLYFARKRNEDGSWAEGWLRCDEAVKDWLRNGRKDSCPYVEMISSWNLDLDYLGSQFDLGEEVIHILLELPQDAANQTPIKKRKLQNEVSGVTNRKTEFAPVQDNTTWWLAAFHKCQIAEENLPLVEELTEFLKQELPVKICVTDEMFNQWSAKVKPSNPELMSNLFQVSNSEPCIDFIFDIVRPIVAPISKVGDTKKSFVTFWDSLFRSPLDYLTIGNSNRGSYRSASTGPTCPHFLFYVDSVCVFRGQEKDPGVSMDTARLELAENVVWCYDKAPYLFGYTAVGFDTRLYAIICRGGQVQIVELGNFCLHDAQDRLRLFLAILNIALLLPTIAKMCPDIARSEYWWTIRAGQFRMQFEPLRVIKNFLDPSQYLEAKRHAQLVYMVLKENNVPNVDYLDHVDDFDNRLIFTTRGDEKRPEDIGELFEALKNVLEALVKFHAAGWMHRDIRWPNVIKYRNQNSWFLIDFMDATKSPQYAPNGSHLSQAEHAPEIFNASTHTSAVDLWSVGRLIQTCNDIHWNDLNGPRSQFLTWIMHENPAARLTAVEALKRLRQLENAYLTQLRYN